MNKNKQNGYAIMFTVILVSIISLISIGLSNTTYKQLILSSGSKDSQLSFYMSDMATECALYADIQTNLTTLTSFYCGVDVSGDSYLLNKNVTGSGENITYNFEPESSVSSSSNPCFRISINKNNSTGSMVTTINASGYNICNKSGRRTVERTIQVNY